MQKRATPTYHHLVIRNDGQSIVGLSGFIATSWPPEIKQLSLADDRIFYGRDSIPCDIQLMRNFIIGFLSID